MFNTRLKYKKIVLFLFFVTFISLSHAAGFFNHVSNKEVGNIFAFNVFGFKKIFYSPGERFLMKEEIENYIEDHEKELEQELSSKQYSRSRIKAS